jgi:hypothetical protein
MTADDLRVGLENGAIDASDAAPPRTRLNFQWSLLTLSPAEREELDHRLCALFEEYTSRESPVADEQTFRYLYLMFPTVARGGRPAVPSKDHAAGEGS